MWTKRERVMLKAIGKRYFIELKKMRDYKINSKEYGDTNDLNRNISRLICIGLVYAAKAAIRTAREVDEPDYKAMWEELKKVEEKAARDENASIRFYSLRLRKDLEYLERRHQGRINENETRKK